MARFDGRANLIPFSQKSKEEAREMGKKGGKASVSVRRARKSFREQLKMMLGCAIPKDSPLYTKMRQQMKSLGFSGDPLVQDITLLGMLMRSAKDVKAAEYIRDTIGEKPVDTFEDVTPQSPIILELPKQEEIDAIRKRREERNLADEKKEKEGK